MNITQIQIVTNENEHRKKLSFKFGTTDCIIAGKKGFEKPDFFRH